MPRILILGSKGLLGQALTHSFGKEELLMPDYSILDICDEKELQKYCDAHKPEVIINAAAYNAVDEAETSLEAERKAFNINGYAVHKLAEEARRQKSLFIHFSSDYVFDGLAKKPYIEDAKPNPLSVYGRSKLEGEEMILRLSEGDLAYYIIRTSRLFGARGENGKKTFVDIVIEAAASNHELSFIDKEEISSPTFVNDLAEAVYGMVQKKLPFGIYHRTNDGECSWYEFAKAILEESGLASKIVIKPISAVSLKRPAQRPTYSVLQSTKLPTLRPWREALHEFIKH